MTLMFAELRLILRSRLAAGTLALLLILAGLAVVSGQHLVARQSAVIDRVEKAQAQDFEAVAKVYGQPDGEAGSAAYYTYLLTADRPAPAAFAALGQRDIQPFVLRVNALGLQAQLYASEALNAELALPGVFDFAFVLIYLAPLIVIALTHDLVSGEREAGRLRLLMSMPSRSGDLWLRRAGLRYMLVMAALGLPLILGGVIGGAPVWAMGAMLAVAAIYVAFWFGLCLAIGARIGASATNAAALVGAWILLTLVAPTVANAVIARAIPVAKGVDMTLAQREQVHRAWDMPREATLKPFFVNHPEWSDTAPVTGRFHWKWYYAMHQVGDEAVVDQAADYRASLVARQAWTERVGWLLPGVAAQGLLHRIADTDLAAQLSYQDSVAAFHERLRRFYYPYLFRERAFTRADFDRLPLYQARASTAAWPWIATGLLTVLSTVVLIVGAAQIRRVADGRQATVR
jgi:ABC-2 type transport system permease protein